jgi:hypothetical protein
MKMAKTQKKKWKKSIVNYNKRWIFLQCYNHGGTANAAKSNYIRDVKESGSDVAVLIKHDKDGKYDPDGIKVWKYALYFRLTGKGSKVKSIAKKTHKCKWCNSTKTKKYYEGRYDKKGRYVCDYHAKKLNLK